MAKAEKKSKKAAVSVPAKKPPLPKKKKPTPAKHPKKTKKEDAKPAAVKEKCLAWRDKLPLDKPKQTAVVPYTLDNNSRKTYWPSSLFLNASYANGILVQSKKNYFREGQGYSNAASSGNRFLPCLTPVEARLWCQKHAAHTAVARRFPMEVGRLLGTITLEIKEVSGKKGKGKSDPNADVPDSLREIMEKKAAKKAKPSSIGFQDWKRKNDWSGCKKISVKQATDEAALELRGQARDKVLARSKELQEAWKNIQNCEPYAETWDPTDGSYNQVGKGDDQYVTLKALQEWLAKGIKARTLKDVNENATKELYNGLTRVPVNATDILHELVNMANPQESIYGVPLVCAYPRMTQSAKGVWKIQLGIYMNRLLPEIFTCGSLHIIMSALDEGSYTVSQPLRLPPTGKPVFQSAPYPRVDTSVLEDSIDLCESSDSEIEIIDVDMEGGSRDELVISPFSVKGLLKLLENKGCDVSNWPQIEQQLQGKFQLDLLLHQQHAIAWMIQMEHFPSQSYGINSLIWEERTFPDGGRYYYSPALGQVRLGAPPPHMKGGLLCDEQGLGKTVEVLGLIMATLEELKQRLDQKKKATTNYDGDEYYSAESDDDNEYKAHSTLIIVPPALLVQWQHEIEKAVGQSTVTVSTLVAKDGELKRTLPPPAEDESEDEEDDWDRVLASDIVLTTYDALDKACCQKVLQSVQWGRVVLDEMQEIRSSTTKIAKNCEKLRCDRRWMLSGTPIYQGIEDLRGELNFLRLEPFGAAWEDGFFEFAIQKPWETKDPHAVATLQILGLIALRRSKDMTIAETGAGLLDLKPMTVEYIPVPQSHSERALYCWMEYLVACELELTKDAKKKKKEGRLNASPKKTKADAKNCAHCLRLLRELCITPMLLNGGMGATSQLKAIDNLMSRHNRRGEQRSGWGQDVNEGDDSGGRNGNQVRIMSCDQALRYLTQFTQQARSDQDMVTDMVVGGGRGTTSRDRATDSALRYKDAERDTFNAKEELASLVKTTAKSRWHLAMEQVTTGQYSDGRTHKFSGLWKWRRLTYVAMEKNSKAKARGAKTAAVPTLFTRGWRPSPDFLEELYARRPDLSWSHPHALLASNIPQEVYQKELATAMRDAAKRVPLAENELESLSEQLSKCTESKNKAKEKLIELKNKAAEKDKDTSKEKDNAKGRVKSKNDLEKKVKDLEAKSQQIEEKRQQIHEKMDDFESHDAKLKFPTIVKVRERKNSHGFWKAVVQFDSAEHKEAVFAICGRASSLGATIASRRVVPHIKSMIASCENKAEFATSECQVHPSINHRKKLAEAKKEVEKMKLGLRMVTSTNTAIPSMEEDISKEAGTEHAYVFVDKAVGNQRSLAPPNASALVDSATTVIEQREEAAPMLKMRISKGEEVMQLLHRVVSGKVSPKVAELSAYETLEMLSNGEEKTKTTCTICLGYLGETDEDAFTFQFSSAGGKRKRRDVGITMIKCGHFFCTRCITMYLNQGHGVGCPACRKPFSLASDTILVDVSLKDEEEALQKEREAAKDIVREAGKLLTESSGVLEAELWRALYLAFDLPSNVPRMGDRTFPAIPRDVLMHLRAATGMLPNSRSSTRPAVGSVKGAGRNSKVQALLDLLPTKERCVVFSSNKDCLQHLAEVFKDDKIGYQLLCTGLTTDQLRDAVVNWESGGNEPTDDPPFPVLLVHAGAASAGLTLTAASKMFIMEPFLRQEQEHQAYARCHRYSQKHKVSVKVFYTPVSVESRLLEWRKGGKSSLLVSNDKDAENCNFEENTDFIIHDMDSDDDEGSESGSESAEKTDGDGDEDDHDIAQANYLLGLVD